MGKNSYFFIGCSAAAIVASQAGATDQFSSFGDANYTATLYDVRILTTATFSAPRTVTLATAAAVYIGSGQGSGGGGGGPARLEIIDAGPGVNGVNTLTIAPHSGDTINGTTASVVVNVPRSMVSLWPISSSNWYLRVNNLGGPTRKQVTNNGGSSTNTTGAFIMMGLNGTFAPTSSGNFFFIINGDSANTVVNSGCAIAGTYGTGTPPTTGAAATGTAINTIVLVPSAGTATQAIPFSYMGYVTALTLGTPYWFDIEYRANVSGTCTVNNITEIALEQ